MTRSCSAVSVPSRLAPAFTCTRIGCRVVDGDELLLAGEFELHRLAGLQHGQRDDVLDQHFLLGAEAAADALAEHAHLVGCEAEDAGRSPAG